MKGVRPWTTIQVQETEDREVQRQVYILGIKVVGRGRGRRGRGRGGRGRLSRGLYI